MGNITNRLKKKNATQVHICSSRKELWDKIGEETDIVIDWGQARNVGYFYLTLSDYGNRAGVSPNEEGLQPFKNTLKTK